jgi:hypothetical protein
MRKCSFAMLVTASAILAWGCGNSPTTVTEPSPTNSAAVPTPSGPGAVVTGTIVTAQAPSEVARLTVAVSGTALSSQVNSSGRFMLQGIPPGRVELRFQGPGINAALQLGALQEGQHVDITVAVNGTTVTRVEETGMDLKGVVAGLTGACPTRTFTVAGTAVKTSAATRFEGGTCATLANGVTAEIEGTRQGDGSVLATKVAVEEIGVDLKGVVAGLTGACPTRSFTVAGTAIKTSAATRFEGGTCATLANGVTAEIEGTRQGDGSVLATKVAVEEIGVDLKGVVAGLAGTCPTRSFTVAGTAIKTSAATRFEGVSCATLANGVRVEIEGTRQGDGSVLATKVAVDN